MSKNEKIQMIFTSQNPQELLKEIAHWLYAQATETEARSNREDESVTQRAVATAQAATIRIFADVIHDALIMQVEPAVVASAE